MRRRFRQHDVRRVTELTGLWDFAFLGKVDPEDVQVGLIPFADTMAVPGCFDATPAYAGRRGLAAYRTVVRLEDGAPHRLVFDGVHHWGRVFANGQMLRDHVGGFTQFHADLRGFPPGEVEIVALVDNRYDYARCPLHQSYMDWYHYGGIARGVELHRLGGVWIDGVRAITEDLNARRVRLAVDYGCIAPGGSADLRVTVDGLAVLAGAVALDAERGRIEVTFELPGAALWSPARPVLHRLDVRLGDDDLRERIGLRQISVADQQFRINGEPVRLLGVNRHEMHPDFGHGLPDAVLVTDMQRLRDLGCNFVRGSHYPQDPRFLDLCDEMGLLVWVEATGWQQTERHLTDPHFIQAALTNVDEMVAMAYNHPSVILWGVLNEGDSHVAACRPGYEVLLARLRDLDPSRPVTFASNHPFEDVCLDLADVISINCYPGWYHGTLADISTHLDAIAMHIDSTGHVHKPLIISEIGAGAIYGCRDMNETHWSEQYQAALLDVVIRHLFLSRRRVCGLAIWQYCDVRTTDEVARMLGRPRAFNNKGLVDEYRRPKLAYDVVRRYFRALSGREEEDEV